MLLLAAQEAVVAVPNMWQEDGTEIQLTEIHLRKITTHHPVTAEVVILGEVLIQVATVDLEMAVGVDPTAGRCAAC